MTQQQPQQPQQQQSTQQCNHLEPVFHRDMELLLRKLRCLHEDICYLDAVQDHYSAQLAFHTGTPVDVDDLAKRRLHRMSVNERLIRVEAGVQAMLQSCRAGHHAAHHPAQQ